MKKIEQKITNTVGIEHILTKNDEGRGKRDIFLFYYNENVCLVSLVYNPDYKPDFGFGELLCFSNFCPCCLNEDERKTISTFVEERIANGAIKDTVKVNWYLGDSGKLKNFTEFVFEHYKEGDIEFPLFSANDERGKFWYDNALRVIQEN